MDRESAARENPEMIFLRVFRTLRPRTPAPQVDLQFRPLANASSRVSWAGGRLTVLLAEVFRDSPYSVQEALAWILLSKLFRRAAPAKHLDRYRRFVNRRDVTRQMEQLRRKRGRKLCLPAQGKFFDLVAIFEELNLRFFWGLMARPEIGWSQSHSRTILGHYDTAHHTIILNRALDEERVPRFVVEYVMYHEMLHLRFPEQKRGMRRCVHTAEFKSAEQRFPEYARAQSWLKLWSPNENGRMERDSANNRANGQIG